LVLGPISGQRPPIQGGVHAGLERIAVAAGVTVIR